MVRSRATTLFIVVSKNEGPLRRSPCIPTYSTRGGAYRNGHTETSAPQVQKDDTRQARKTTSRDGRRTDQEQEKPASKTIRQTANRDGQQAAAPPPLASGRTAYQSATEARYIRIKDIRGYVTKSQKMYKLKSDQKKYKQKC